MWELNLRSLLVVWTGVVVFFRFGVFVLKPFVGILSLCTFFNFTCSLFFVLLEVGVYWNSASTFK